MDIKCNLILDSCCDLPHDIVDREGVYLVQFPYFDDDGEHLDDLYQMQTAHDFYEGMRKGSEPHTAQVPMPALQEAYQWAIDQGKPTVYLSFSSGLSGTFDTAQMLLDQMKAEHPDLELYLVDTKLASVAEALLVYEALDQREKGLTAKELVTWAEEARYFVDAQFMVDDLEALRRGDRIPSTVAFAGSKLDVKPLLGIDMNGKLALTGVARGRKKGVKSLIDYWTKRRTNEGPVQNVVVGGADCPKDQERLVSLLAKEDETAIVLESSIGPVIGSHVGPGMLAVVFWGPDKRNDLSVADRIASKVRGK